MTSLLFTIGGAVVNALAFSGTNFVFSQLTDHGEEERKRHDLALEKLQRARDKWNEDRMKRRYISAMLMTLCLNITEYLQSPYHMSLSYQVFTNLQGPRKMVNYYLLP